MRHNNVAAQTKLHPTRTSALAYNTVYSKNEKLYAKYIRPIEIRARDKRGVSSPLKSSAILFSISTVYIYCKVHAPKMLALEIFLCLTEKIVTPVEIVVRMLRVIRHQKNIATRLFLLSMWCHSTAKYYTQCHPQIITKKKQILALGWNNIDSLSSWQHQLRSGSSPGISFGCLPARDIRFVGANVVCVCSRREREREIDISYSTYLLHTLYSDSQSLFIVRAQGEKAANVYISRATMCLCVYSYSVVLCLHIQKYGDEIYYIDDMCKWLGVLSVCV